MKTTSLSSLQRLALVFLGLTALVGLQARATAQTTIGAASYNPDGSVNSGNTYNLDAFVVTGTSGTSTAFITDASGSARIYGASAVSQLTVGTQYTATVTSSAYQGYEEFDNAANIAPTGMLGAVTPLATTPAAVESDVTIAASPSAGTNYNLNFAPLTFTLTPTSSGTLSTSGETDVPFGTNGGLIDFYKSSAATSFTAGTTYTVTANENPYDGLSELNNAVLTAAVPEPQTGGTVLLGGIVLVGALIRRRGHRCV